MSTDHNYLCHHTPDEECDGWYRDGAGWYREDAVTSCGFCDELMYWIDCPIGGWWKHVDHPTDDHDGEAPAPADTYSLEDQDD